MVAMIRTQRKLSLSRGQGLLEAPLVGCVVSGRTGFMVAGRTLKLPSRMK